MLLGFGYMGQPVYARTILVPLLVNATISYRTLVST